MVMLVVTQGYSHFNFEQYKESMICCSSIESLSQILKMGDGDVDG